MKPSPRRRPSPAPARAPTVIEYRSLPRAVVRERETAPRERAHVPPRWLHLRGDVVGIFAQLGAVDRADPITSARGERRTGTP